MSTSGRCRRDCFAALAMTNPFWSPELRATKLARIEDLELLGGETDRGGRQILFEMGDRGGAWDRQHDGRAVQEPGEGDLPGCRMMAFGNPVER